MPSSGGACTTDFSRPREKLERNVDSRGGSESWALAERVCRLLDEDGCSELKALERTEIAADNTTVIRDLFQDLRHALRTLRRTPGFTAVVIATLGLGLGANAAIFSLVDALLLRPLPVREPRQLVAFADGLRSGRNIGLPLRGDGSLTLASHPLYQRLRTAEGLEGLAGQDSAVTPAMVARGGTPERALGRCVTANFFSVLGVAADRGRLFSKADEAGDLVVVLGHGYWRRRFGGDPQVVGGRLTINGAPYSVVGIAAPGFTGAEVGAATDFWVPLGLQPRLTGEPSMLGDRQFWWMHLLGRLRPGTNRAVVEASANALLRQFLAEDPRLLASAGSRPVRIAVLPAATGLSAPRASLRGPLAALMAGVGLLLLIVCLNLGHLLLARAHSRQREMRIRAALGATRGRLLRQPLAEAVILALAGAAAGLGVARWLGEALIGLAGSGAGGGGGPAPLTLELALDERTLLSAGVSAVGVAIALGLLPAWQAARAALSPLATSAAVIGAARRALLVSQVAISLVLVVAAALLGGSLTRLRAVRTGFDARQVLLVDTDTQILGRSEQEALAVCDELLRRIRALPGVSDASMSHPWPLIAGATRWGIDFPGTTIKPVGVDVFLVTPHYFDTLGMRLVRGRPLVAGDGRGARRVAVVNEAMVGKAYPGSPGVARHFRMMETDHDIEVVGVVADVRVHGPREEPRPAIYLPAPQSTGIPGGIPFLRSLEVRASGDPALLAAAVRRVVREVEPALPVVSVRTMTSQIDRNLVQERLLATLAGAFGLAALLLVALGLYGVITQWSAQRTREIAIRMALGARAAGVRWLVLRQAFLLVAAGLAVGLPGAVAASRLVRGLLFGIDPLDPATLVAAALLMLAVAALAASLPARRAARIPPMSALRGE
jgi:predicted permease